MLAAHFGTSSTFAREVPFYEKRIDLLVLPHRGSELISIEAKVDDWRRAYGQAIVNLAAADFSYIALWERRLGSIDKEALIAMGIGLISVGASWDSVAILIKAKRSKLASNEIKALLRRILKKA